MHKRHNTLRQSMFQQPSYAYGILELFVTIKSFHKVAVDVSNSRFSF